MFSILKSTGALPFYSAVLLNAVIDLGHKITLQNTIFKIYDSSEQVILTAIVNAIILLPYILLFVPIGYLANKTPKPQMMRLAAMASIALTALLLVFYLQGWFWLAFGTTFLMSVQSAFYSPAKLGYLKTLFGRQRLLEANGLAQSIVIIGILLSTVLFSLGFEWIYSGSKELQAGIEDQILARSVTIASMWPLILGLIALALIQLFLVFRVPEIPEVEDCLELPAIQSGSHKQSSTWFLVLPDFYVPILGLALFWALGQGVLAIFPAFAKSEAAITNTAVIQGVLTCTGMGILLGSWLATLLNRVSHVRQNVASSGLRIAMLGMGMMVAGLFTLTLFNTALIYALQFLFVGVASGLLIVPLNAYIQLSASHEMIGSVISCSNLIQNVAMLGTLGLTIAMAFFAVTPASLLLVLSVVALVVAVFLIPALARLSG